MHDIMISFDISNVRLLQTWNTEHKRNMLSEQKLWEALRDYKGDSGLGGTGMDPVSNGIIFISQKLKAK